MERNEFYDYIDNCIKRMIDKQKDLIKISGIANHNQIHIPKEDDTVQFKKDGKLIVDFSAIPIGSWSGLSNSWQWAWANVSIGQNAKMQSEKLKELTDLTGYTIFSADSPSAFSCEHVSHELLAVSLNHLDAIGYCRRFFSKEKLTIYYALMEIRQIKKEFIMDSEGIDIIDEKSDELLKKIDAFYGDYQKQEDNVSRYTRQAQNIEYTLDEQKIVLEDMAKNFNYEVAEPLPNFININVGTDFEVVVDLLLQSQEKGEDVCCDYNGHILYSRGLTIDSAYFKVFGMTKEEFEKAQKEELKEWTKRVD